MFKSLASACQFIVPSYEGVILHNCAHLVINMPAWKTSPQKSKTCHSPHPALFLCLLNILANFLTKSALKMLKVCRFHLSQVMEPKTNFFFDFHIRNFTSKGLSNFFRDRMRTLTKESTILWPVNAILCFLQMYTLITWPISAILKWAAKPFTVQKATRNLVDGN